MSCVSSMYVDMSLETLQYRSLVNMVTTKVQQVTVRSKAKRSEWEIQEAIQTVVKEWVDKANNNNNVARMLQDNDASFEAQPEGQLEPKTTPEDEETWKILVDCQVSLPLATLLKLVPKFTEKVATIIA